MRTLLLSALLSCWLASPSFAEALPDPQAAEFPRCDLCVVAVADADSVLSAQPMGDSYAEFRITKVLFGGAAEFRAGAPVTVTLRRRAPAISAGEKYVLFLERMGPAIEPVWITVDAEKAVMRHTPELMRALKKWGEPRQEPRARPRVSAVDLAGAWLLTLPAGFEYEAKLQPTDVTGEFRLECGAANLRGVYRLEGSALTVTQPANKRLAGLTWDVLNRNALVLIAQPIPSPVGADYRRATLTRQK